ncbi:MAG: GNAT family N-acetyltransferase [Geminicoccaceae bacterium]|nr:GNAT family N-acetyltransferase [Geminicoccaceae bacterium]
MLDATGYLDLPPGRLATLVTYLEMREPPPARPVPERPDLALRRWERPEPEAYRALYRRVGEPWLWFSRLLLTDAALTAILHRAGLEVWLPERAGEPIGILELDFRTAGECELAFFGLVPEAVGTGAGRWLMARALERAWRPGIGRVWVHTCHLDHPEALGFYLRSGFRPYKLAIEVFDDPRLSGVLPRTAAPRVPLIEP